MILINLLPHREAARKRRREQFLLHLGLAMAGGVVVSLLAMLVYESRIEAQRSRNAIYQAEIAKLDAQIREVSDLKSQLDALKARQQTVENLQADRNLPVHLLEELVRQLPDGIYLSSMKQEDGVITLAGMAQSQERVSELLRNLGGRSSWLSRPQLIEIVAADVNVPQRGARRVSSFSIRVTLTRGPGAPVEVDAPARGGQPAGRV